MFCVKPEDRTSANLSVTMIDSFNSAVNGRCDTKKHISSEENW